MRELKLGEDKDLSRNKVGIGGRGDSTRLSLPPNTVLVSTPQASDELSVLVFHGPTSSSNGQEAQGQAKFPALA